MPDPTDIAAVLLAAGVSRRFGSEKLLHPVVLGGQSLPLIVHSLRAWLGTFREVSIVIRPDADHLVQAVRATLPATDDGRLHWIVCENAAQGMGASLACGISANRAASGWLVGLADMPAVPQAAIVAVRDAIAAGQPLAAPFHQGRRGHPVGLSHTYLAELVALQGDTGARNLLTRDAQLVSQIDIDHPGIFSDIDLPADLHNLPWRA